MKRLALATGALGALLVLAPCGRTGEDQDLRAIIDKAIQVQGGEAKLAKFKTQATKATGKFHGLGEPIDFTMDLTTEGETSFAIAMVLSTDSSSV